MADRKSFINNAFRPEAVGVEQVLGSLQAVIMECLWEQGPQSPAELHKLLSAKQEIAYTTVFTELSRLSKKGAVRKKARQSQKRYEATASKETFISSMVSQVLGGLIDAHGAAAIHGFVDIVADDAGAFEQLSRLVSAKRKRRRLAP
ncbi:MAG: BlaI/MecI/CopY family transcriptional regulator [Candidatus Eremiobacteraeota bacterium]|nr:BlaI/MecI/CopY family transcriptional regulator [Candidatus Eremiobacteraeota bacterium]